MKVIAFYLPQFHEIEENNRWWGQGFTEWTNVKKAKPLYAGHNQPREPLNDNYYDLTHVDSIAWQAKMAKEYGIYGFCIYHYWFGGKMLLQKPAELLLEHPEIDINFCFCWANESWTNAWVSKENQVLIEQQYGDKEEWTSHYNYFFKFFNDSRYIKENNKPLLVIYRPENIPNLNEMLSFLNELAVKSGFDGIAFAYQQSRFEDIKGDDTLFDYNIEYQPQYALRDLNNRSIAKKWLHRMIDRLNDSIFKNNALKRNREKVKVWDYDVVWEAVLNHQPSSKKCVAGAFVDWDNTPRRQTNGYVISGGTPEKFGNYLKRQLKNIEQRYATEYLFVFAWNEWAEGGYLEPDKTNAYGYLEQIKNALKESL